MPQTILIVDDKVSVTRMLGDYFTAQGFRSVVAANGRDALFAARHEKPDLILLDIMMPEMDGYDFIRSYRKESNTPIILLTAKLEETDKVVGLELGADDYVTKPFGMAELLARVRAVLRRSKQEKVEADILRVSDVTLEKKSRVVKVSERAVELTPSEFDLLVILMTTPGRVFSRSELLEQMQGHSFAGVERTIDVHVRNLRTKIELEPSEPHYIETVFGVGYRFKAND